MNVNDLPVRATVFEYGRGGYDGNNRELWKEVAEGVSAANPDGYKYDEQRPWSLALIGDVVSCPEDARLKRYRTIRANIVRVGQHSILIELSVGNCFSFDGIRCEATADVVKRTPSAARWIRSSSRVSHLEHLQRVAKFVQDARLSGWEFSLADLEQVHPGPVILKNNKGAFEYQTGIKKSLVNDPLKAMEGREVVILSAGGNVPAGVVSELRTQLRKYPSSSVVSGNTVRVLRNDERVPKNALLLVLIPKEVDLSASKDWINYLVSLESKGRIFKLVTWESLNKRFAIQNICHDLFMLDGGCLWTGEYSALNDVIAVDAGHDTKKKKTLWVSASYALTNNDISMRFDQGELHEDLPESVLDDIRVDAERKKYTFFRDGRFHKGEVRSLNDRGVANEDIYFVVKSPGAILFRGTMDDPSLPQFGDGLVYPNGAILMQSLEPNSTDYQRPVSLRAVGSISTDAITDVLALCKQPNLGLFHESRLPAPIYWADLASKRDIRGWAKAIGRGWGIPPL